MKLLLSVTLALFASQAQAHRMALARVIVQEGEQTQVSVALNAQAAKHQLRPLPPHSCVQAEPWRRGMDAHHLATQWQCSGAITELHFSMSGRYKGTVMARLQRVDGAIERVSRAGAPIAFTAQAKAQEARRGHFVAGMSHLLSGWDHLLLIALITLVAASPKQLLGATLAFTAGHALSLGIAAAGQINWPAVPVEICIALSLLLMAQLSLRPPKRGLPLTLLVAFGLLHGLGLASGFAGTGLSGWALLGAVIAFNLGVELAQLIWLAVVLLARHSLPLRHAHGHIVLSYIAGTLAAYWMIERAMELGGV